MPTLGREKRSGWRKLRCRILPRQKLINPVLPVAVDSGGERGGQVGLRINRIELTRLDERGDGRPVLSISVVPGEECVLAIEGNRPDCSLDSVVVDLDAAVGQKELQTIPVLAM